MRILELGGTWFPGASGGMDRYFHGLAGALAEGGDFVDAFAVGTPPVDAPANERTFSVAPDRPPFAKRMIQAAASYRRNLRGRYDAVNMHFAPYALPALPFIRNDGPVVFTFHGPWAGESASEGSSRASVAVKHAVERFVYGRADRFITLSNAFRELLFARYGIPRASVHVLPMGIDVDAYLPGANRRELRDELGWRQDRFVIFTARRLVHRVGLPELIHAISRLDASDRGNLLLVIAGRGPIEAALRVQINELDLAATVMLAGYLSENDLRKAYAAADLSIVPSQALEGFGTIVAESLASGTPVAVTPVDGLPDAVSGLEGLVIADRTSEAMSAYVRDVLHDRIPLPSSERCREYAVERFAWPVVAANVRAVFAS